jgi:general stress protein 26
MLVLAAPGLKAQDDPRPMPPRDSIVAAAQEVIAAARYGALITIDSTGQPRARVMDPFPPGTDMTVWLATNPKSRKVVHIETNPRVMLYYFDPGSLSYVTLAGVARVVDDPDEKARRWKEGWDMFYPDRDESYLLIEVTPVRLEVVSLKHGLTGDPVTWTPDGVALGSEP